MQLTQAMIDGDWVVTVNSQTDICDLTTPDEMGRVDALLGCPCNPTEYFAKLGDIELYCISWKETMGELPIIVNGVDVAGELGELLSGREDEEYHRMGAW